MSGGRGWRGGTRTASTETVISFLLTNQLTFSRALVTLHPLPPLPPLTAFRSFRAAARATAVPHWPAADKPL